MGVRNDPPVSAADDVKLLSQICSGSRDAFAQFVRANQAKVRCYLGRFLRDADVVDDLAQETFIAAFRSIDSYKEQSSLGLWLLGIARNLALKYLREEQRRRSRESDSLEIAFSRWSEKRVESDDPSRQHHDQVVEALRICIGGLQKHSASILRDAYFNGRTAAEIAGATGKSEGAIWVTMLRIRQSLRDCIGARMARAESR